MRHNTQAICHVNRAPSFASCFLNRSASVEWEFELISQRVRGHRSMFIVRASR